MLKLIIDPNIIKNYANLNSTQSHPYKLNIQVKIPYPTYAIILLIKYFNKMKSPHCFFCIFSLYSFCTCSGNKLIRLGIVFTKICDK